MAHPGTLRSILLSHRLISPKELVRAEEIQRSTGERMSQVLLRCGMVSEERLVSALANALGVRPWNLRKDPPRADVAGLIASDICQHHRMVPVEVRGDQLLVAMSDPRDSRALQAATLATGLRIEPVLACNERLEAYLTQLGEMVTPSASVEELVERALQDVIANEFHPEALENLGEDDVRPVVGLVNQVIADAVRFRASDIHLEPREDQIEVRFRIDGRLVKMSSIPVKLLPMVVARLKIMGEMDVVEYRLPQDGRFTLRNSGRTIDVRLSVLPNLHGQRVVMRLLDRSTALKPLESLGFSESNLDQFKKLAVKPYGLLLVTGPTGSGKTTTLYAGLSAVQNDSLNVMTAEDPIEYDIPGINQSQVNEKVGLTFGEQLRAILRQDPDVVLVGEIRDQETAEIAMRASMTGHLVLSTLHTNDAFSAIPRLEDLGIKPHVISGSLIGVLAQRLVRVLCPHCRQIDPNSASILKILGRYIELTSDLVFAPRGCEKCQQTGYRGRIAISELLPCNGPLSRQIARGASVEELRSIAETQGFVSMQSDAASRVLSGETSFAEAAHVVFFDDLDIPTSHHKAA